MAATRRSVGRFTGPPATTPVPASEYPALVLDADREDVLDKVNAGARLVYAMHHHPQARELFASPLMTPSLLKAYLAAARAWDL
jgi:hypothetical protein